MESSDDDDSGYAIDYTNYLKIKSELVYNYYFSSKYLFLNFNKRKSKLLEYQLPLQDITEEFCLNLKNDLERYKLAEFALKRKQNNFGQGIIRKLNKNEKWNEKIICKECKLPIKNNTSLIITAIKHFDLFSFWHPNCFICFECKELLINLIYFAHKDNIFCGRHHAELSRPRCISCDELIFGDECTEAEGKIWHLEHFCCLKCNKQLAGCQYIIKSYKNKQFPFCLFCYNNLLYLNNNNKCINCLNEINKDEPYIIITKKNKQFKFHLNKNCFCCSICKKELLFEHSSYSFFNGKLFCTKQTICENNKKYSINSLSSSLYISSNNSSSSSSSFHSKSSKILSKQIPPPLPKSNPPPIPPDIQTYFQ
ncbi:hypothetical protein Mgra_00001985, partial [Meloidogyne graminicola]